MKRQGRDWKRSNPQDSIDLAKQISALCAGKPIDLVGAALADAVGMWLCQHPRVVWEEVLRLHTTTALALAEPNAKMVARVKAAAKNVGHKEGNA